VQAQMAKVGISFLRRLPSVRYVAWWAILLAAGRVQYYTYILHNLIIPTLIKRLCNIEYFLHVFICSWSKFNYMDKLQYQCCVEPSGINVNPLTCKKTLEKITCIRMFSVCVRKMQWLFIEKWLKQFCLVGFDVFMAASMTMAVFWVVAPCSQI
jgi:hypothetical protein